MSDDDPFWNLTDGVRPTPPVPGLFARICADTGKHVYDSVYGPHECARCGARLSLGARIRAALKALRPRQHDHEERDANGARW